MKNVDLIIIGGGLVGASLACGLKDSGLSIVVLEAVQKKIRLNPHFDARSIALSYGSMAIFKNWQLWEKLSSFSAPIAAIQVSRKGHFAKTRIQAKEMGLAQLGAVLPIQILLGSLLEAIDKANNISLIAPGAVTQVQLKKDKVVVEVKREGQHETFSAALLVGADGQPSILSKKFALSEATKNFHHDALVTTVTTSADHNGTAFERFTENGPIALLPLSPKKMALVWSLTKDDILAKQQLASDFFLQSLHEAVGFPAGRFLACDARIHIPLKASFVRDQVRPGAVILGNASHLLHPIAAQGFNLSLRDVQALAAEIKSATQKGESIGSMAVLNAYLAGRCDDQTLTRKWTESLVDLFIDDATPLAMAKGVAFAALDRIKPLKKWLAEYPLGLKQREQVDV